MTSKQVYEFTNNKIQKKKYSNSEDFTGFWQSLMSQFDELNCDIKDICTYPASCECGNSDDSKEIILCHIVTILNKFINEKNKMISEIHESIVSEYGNCRLFYNQDKCALKQFSLETIKKQYPFMPIEKITISKFKEDFLKIYKSNFDVINDQSTRGWFEKLYEQLVNKKFLVKIQLMEKYNKGFFGFFQNLEEQQ